MFWNFAQYQAPRHLCRSERTDKCAQYGRIRVQPDQIVTYKMLRSEKYVLHSWIYIPLLLLVCNWHLAKVAGGNVTRTFKGMGWCQDGGTCKNQSDSLRNKTPVPRGELSLDGRGMSGKPVLYCTPRALTVWHETHISYGRDYMVCVCASANR